eukprot:s1260_g7.t1
MSDRDILRFLWSEDAQGGKAVGRGWAEWRQEKATLMLAAKGVAKVVEPTIIPISLRSAASQPDLPAAASSARPAPVEQPSPEPLAPGMPKAAGQPPMPTPNSFELKEGEAVFQNFLYKQSHEGDKWIRQRPLSADEILQIGNAPRPNKKTKTDEGALPTRQLDVTGYAKTLQEWQEKNFPACPELVGAIVECLEKKKLR